MTEIDDDDAGSDASVGDALGAALRTTGPLAYFQRRIGSVLAFGEPAAATYDQASSDTEETAAAPLKRSSSLARDLDMPQPLESAAALEPVLSHTERFKALVRHERALATKSTAALGRSLTDEVNAIYDRYAEPDETDEEEGGESTTMADRAAMRSRAFAESTRRKYSAFMANAATDADAAEPLGMSIVDRIKRKVAKAAAKINDSIQKSASSDKRERAKLAMNAALLRDGGEDMDSNTSSVVLAARSLPPLVPLRSKAMGTQLLPPLVPLRSLAARTGSPPLVAGKKALTSSSSPALAVEPISSIPEHDALARTVRDLALDGPFNVDKDVRALFAAAAPATPGDVYDGNLVLASALGTVRERAEKMFQTSMNKIVHMYRAGGSTNSPTPPLSEDMAKRTSDRLCALVRTESLRAKNFAAAVSEEAQTLATLQRGKELGESIMRALGASPHMRTVGLAAAALTDMVALTQDRATGGKYPADTAKRIEAFWSQPMKTSAMLHARAHFE